LPHLEDVVAGERLVARRPGSRRTYVITGGAGFIGSHLAERLATEAHIVLFDNLRRNSLRFTNLAMQENVEFVEGDIRDRGLLERVIKNADAVLHLAAIAGVSSYYAEPENTLRVNIEGTAAIVDAVAAMAVPRLLYVSTSEVYGAHARDVDEESPCAIGPPSDQRWVYATSKIAGEHLVLRGAEQRGFSATVLRPFNVYGPRQTGEGAVHNFCAAALSGAPLEIYGDGSAVRAWCFVEDFVAAAVSALTTSESAGEVFNIGNPNEAIDTNGLAALIASLVPGAEVRPREVKRAEVVYRTPVIAKARKMLRFEPRIGLAEGLQRTIDWMSSRLSDEKVRS
jgi:UDP-glucuronate decarboxylase